MAQQLPACNQSGYQTDYVLIIDRKPDIRLILLSITQSTLLQPYLTETIQKGFPIKPHILTYVSNTKIRVGIKYIKRLPASNGLINTANQNLEGTRIQKSYDLDWNKIIKPKKIGSERLIHSKYNSLQKEYYDFTIPDSSFVFQDYLGQIGKIVIVPASIYKGQMAEQCGVEDMELDNIVYWNGHSLWNKLGGGSMDATEKQQQSDFFNILDKEFNQCHLIQPEKTSNP